MPAFFGFPRSPRGVCLLGGGWVRVGDGTKAAGRACCLATGAAAHRALLCVRACAAQAKELLDHLEGVLSNKPVELVTGNQAVEIKPQGVSKGQVRNLERTRAVAHRRAREQRGTVPPITPVTAWSWTRGHGPRHVSCRTVAALSVDASVPIAHVLLCVRACSLAGGGADAARAAAHRPPGPPQQTQQPRRRGNGSGGRAGAGALAAGRGGGRTRAAGAAAGGGGGRRAAARRRRCACAAGVRAGGGAVGPWVTTVR